MDKTTITDSVNNFAQAAWQIIPTAAVVLFGSHAQGTSRIDSDIDIAIIVDGFTGDYLQTSAALWHLTWKIDDRIEPILLDRQTDRSGFVAEVMRSGLVIRSEQNV